ncbi:MAG: PQQ-binding-like beta-propeller repeat protein [Polyangiaceae bacterium]|nr:PQQ-binding-like beta-propeller repeat protein [Polyangiaceae bacterium]
MAPENFGSPGSASYDLLAMPAVHVVVRALPDPPSVTAHAPLTPLRGLVDLVVDGVNLTARIGSGEVAPFLGDLAVAVGALATGRRDRASVGFHAADESWELGLERDGDGAWLTLFRPGRLVEVAIDGRRIALDALASALLAALQQCAPRTGMLGAALESAERALADARPFAAAAPLLRVEEHLVGRGTRSVAVGARVGLRRGVATPAPAGARVERADVHALLLRGSLSFVVRGRAVELDGVLVYLVLEELVGLCSEALDAAAARRPLHRRFEVDGARVALTLAGAEGGLTLSISPTGEIDDRAAFPALDPTHLARAVARAAAALVEATLRHDPGQDRNLRLARLRARAEALAERLDEALDDSLANPEPESYRAWSRARPIAPAGGTWAHGGRMRFEPRWVATVPGVDLQGVLLCGERVVVNGARETACIDRATGALAWRVPSARAALVPSPLGVLRLTAEGRVHLHELATGEVRFSAAVAPRAGGQATGAVVHAPGLPRLLVIVEDLRRITALDLTAGEIRWRHTARRPGSYRLRRAGKLLVVAGGDSALFALDVTTGEVVWRVRDRLPFTGDVTIDHDAALALGGAPAAAGRLHHVDAWSGERRWAVDLDARAIPGIAPLVAGAVVVVPVRDRAGVGARAFERSTGRPLWSLPTGFAAPTTAWLAVDDAVFANSGAGVLTCIDAATGGVRYSHVFPRPAEADTPRRLEPVLRSGALFVPQHRVHVVRPADGDVLGIVPCDLVPDRIRVDERSGVYVVEESGHLAAFGAAPRLTLVR